MEPNTSVKVITILLVISIASTSSIMMGKSAGSASPFVNLTMDDIICNIGTETLILDFETSNRSILVQPTQIQIRSHHLSFYDLNISDGHSDTNLVSGDYCYATIPAINATLNNIRAIDNLGFSTDSGSATVSILKNTDTHIKLQINSSNDAELNIFVYNLIPYDKYKLSVDGNRIELKKSTGEGTIQFEYDEMWSSHIFTISYEGFVYWNDFAVSLLKIGFVIGIGAIALTILFTRRKSGRG